MIVIIDDALDEKTRQQFVAYFKLVSKPNDIQWLCDSFKDFNHPNLPIKKLLSIAKQYFDVDKMVGCEFWSHYGTKPDWHIDKDEMLMNTKQELSCPICSIVYYAEINGLYGGKFLTQTETIAPIQNRLLIFSPKILHSVEKYSGTRMSVAVNPWETTPIQHKSKHENIYN